MGLPIGVYIWANTSIKRKHTGDRRVDVLRNNRILRLVFRSRQGAKREDRAADGTKIRCATGKLWLGSFCLFLYIEEEKDLKKFYVRRKTGDVSPDFRQFDVVRERKMGKENREMRFVVILGW